MTPEQLLHESDRCVKCGLCLPHCPTYRLRQEEGDSPRGRIALVQAMAAGRLRDTPRLRAHLDRCLGCRACERACPSGVRYGRLMDGLRAMWFRRRGLLKRRLTTWTLGLLARPALLAVGAGLLRWLPRHSLPAVLRRPAELSPGVVRPAGWRRRYPPAGRSAGRVALLLGCVGRFSDQAAQRSLVRLLNRLGWEVVVPPAQRCCGALFRHAGDPAMAQRLEARNRRAFGRGPLEAILSTASGCGAYLEEHGGLPAPVRDASEFLDRVAWSGEVALRPLPRRVAVHDACSLRTADAVYRLLGRIPEIELVPLTGNAFCCGAGGLSLLTEPAQADALLEPKLAGLRASGATLLLTSNTGCALHFAAGIRRAGLDVEVLHPVQLLERQLADPDDTTG